MQYNSCQNYKNKGLLPKKDCPIFTGQPIKVYLKNKLCVGNEAFLIYDYSQLPALLLGASTLPTLRPG